MAVLDGAAARVAAVTGAVLALGAGALTPAAGASTTSVATHATRCSVFSYVGKHGVSTYVSSAAITHASQLGIGPGVTHQVTKTAEHQRTLTASTTTDKEASGSAGWLWASVSAKYHKTVAKAGQRTTSHSVSVTDTVRNTTGRNQAFVAYRGYTRYHGSYWYTICKADTSSGIGSVVKKTGKYQTWGSRGEGIVWCKGGKPTALIAAAINLYCG